MKAQLFYLISFFLFPSLLFAQVDSTLQTIEFDQQEHEILVSPTLSANLIGSNQWEVNIFNTLIIRDIENTRINKRPFINTYDTLITQFQDTRLENIIQIQHGLPVSTRLNIGIDIYVSHIRTDNNIKSSPFRVLGNNAEGGKSRRDITALGPRARWMPFRQVPELTLQGSVVFGLNNLSTRKIYKRDRTQMLTQVTFYQRFQPWLYGFVQTDASVFLKNDDFQNNTFTFPVFLYASANIWGLRSNAYPKLYGLLSWSHASSYDDNIRGKEGLTKRSFESHVGIGILSQLDPQWGIQLWSYKPISHNIGSASNEVIPGSWYGLSLGLRYTWISLTERQ
jgi:hypothetical protein